jgi:hypothetical protein
VVSVDCCVLIVVSCEFVCSVAVGYLWCVHGRAED